MGAHDFCDEETGKTAREAFNNARAEATYHYGHDPYNGTISTVSGFVQIELPPRVTTAKAQAMWLDGEELGYAREDVQKLQDPNSWAYKGHKTKASRAKALTRAKRKVRKLEKALGKHANLAQKIAGSISKWESCVCVERKGAELKKWKESRGLKGKRGIRSFVFFGLAAC